MAEYKVIRVSDKPSNAWNGPNGTIYYQNYMLEGHPKPVSIGKKQPDTIKVGDVLNGSITQDSGPNDKFKAEFNSAPKQGGYTKSPADQDSIVRQSALKSAVAAVTLYTSADEVVKIAEIFYAWLSKATDTDTPGYEAAKATAEKIRAENAQDEEDGKDAIVDELTDLSPEAESLLGTEPGEINLEDIPF